MKNTNGTLYRVFLKPREGRKTEVKGDTAEALLEAIQDVLDARGVQEKLVGNGFIQHDPTLPENVSLVDASAMAIALGHETKKEIATYLEKYIESHL